jgi:OOP family OmpA-OmpF porin
MALALTLCASVAPAAGLTLDLPDRSVTSLSRDDGLSSYAVPTGPFASGAVPTRTVEGPLRQTAWRVDQPGATTLDLLAPLRAQVQAEGFRTLFECEAEACGGFDFRFATLVLPEPEMHVDLGDFRFYAAERGDEVISLLVSRTTMAGFVQLIHVGAEAKAPPVLTASTMAAEPATADLGTRLLSGGSEALDDLVFASGSATLASGDYSSLRDLAAWLRENPGLTVALVGHTDASGALEGNIALSHERAEAVRTHLVQTEGIPPAQVEAQGVGYLSPRATNLSDAGREKNRRVEVMVTSTRVAP